MDGSKLTAHVEYASISYSLDSLSFSGLVSSIQDHQPKSPSSPNGVTHYLVSKPDLEFEFTSTKANLNSAVSPIKITPADQLISNGQLRPQALAIQTNQTQITNPPSSSSSLLATDSSSKMSCGKTGSSNKYQEHTKGCKHTNKIRPPTRKGFGQKMKSLLSPCRECQTVKRGAVKAQTIPGENLKIY